MSSVVKALDLMSHFSVGQPEIGLSQLCRIAKRDKSTTYRHLQALEIAGFIEQNPITRQYRLGPAVLQFAQTREATVPRKAAAEAAISTLANQTGETSHVSILSGSTVYALAACESPKHSTRAIIDLDTFPLHATASGLCALAFGSEELMDTALSNLTAFTHATISNPKTLTETVQKISETGFGQANRSFETDIVSIAAPLFDQTGQFVGAVSVASVATRFTPALEQAIKENLVIASRAITHNWGGVIPPRIEGLWAASINVRHEMETAS